VGLKVADAADSNSFHKLAAHKLIQSIEKAYRYELETCDILYAKKNVLINFHFRLVKKRSLKSRLVTRCSAH
jgi:hypothetical protein